MPTEPEPTAEGETDPVPRGEWKSCDNDMCDYHAMWGCDAGSGDIKFWIGAKQDTSRWSGIGFGTASLEW